MQSETTAELSLFQLSERAFGSNPKTDEVTAFTTRLSAQPLFVRGMRDPTTPGALHISFIDSADGDESYVTLATSRELAESLPGDGTEDNEFISITGKDLLGFADQGHITALIVTSDSNDDDILIPARTLDLLAKLASLLSNEAPHQPPSEAAIRAAYPTEFAHWLYDYCRANADISEARLALALVGNGGVPDVVVALKARSEHSHMERISAESRRLMRPGQVFYTEDKLAKMGPEGTLSADLQRHRPLYSHNHSQSWWSRMMRKLKPAPLVVINVALSDDATQ